MSPAEVWDTAATWFPYLGSAGTAGQSGQSSEAEVVLLCLHYAGGTAATYRQWGQALGDRVRVVPVQLPGRGTRLGEEPYDSVAPLAADLATSLATHGLTRDYALFGHSMGALLAYELACELRDRGTEEPRHLFVSGSRAPHLYGDRTDHRLSDPELRALIQELGGLGHVEETIGTAYFRRRLPILRADLRMCDTYRWRPRPPLGCRMTAYSATEDPIASTTEVEAWRAYTSSSFVRRHFPGGHFFLSDDPARARLLRDLRGELNRPHGVPVTHTQPATT
ncbi:thioesterase II family protein [Streptomyces oceani]|uniref:Thioesterase n=1 Tax=Streptomyces oceani TaxID=1075402 RepID=A0A1E7KEU6_9ACTN|nr:alpha/beta fold hydrolase [Streptomyces oceani]OEV02442.1 thioesterase [Streptomyces oceani]